MADQITTPTATPPMTKMSIDDFANTIKTKYPAYQAVDNKTLVQKIVTKYPVYADKVDISMSNLGGSPAPDANQESQAKYKSTFAANPNGSAVGEAAKLVGNIPSSAFGLAKSAADVFNPVSTVKKVADIASNIGGLRADKKAESQGNQNVADENNMLIEKYKTMKSAGQDTSHIEDFAKKNGIDLSKVQVAKPTKGAFQSAVEEAPGAAITSFVPEYLRAGGRVAQGYVTGNNQMIDENLQRAERAIVNDPVGQGVQTMLLAEGGAKALDKAGITTDAAGMIDRGVSKTAQAGMKTVDTVTKPVQGVFGKVTETAGKGIDYAKEAAGATARKLAGINKETAQRFAERPDLKPVDEAGLIAKKEGMGAELEQGYATEKAKVGTNESLGQKIQSAIGKRASDLEETGSGYTPIRKSAGEPVKIAPNYLAQTIKENTGLEIDNGQLKTKGSASIRDVKDVRALQHLYDTWQPTFKSGKMTANEFLNFRSDLAKIAKFDREITTSAPLENLSGIMRGKFNTQFRGNIKGLAELDAKFSVENSELKTLSKGLVDKNGNLTDAGLSKISKATKNKPQLLAQLEKISPGIIKEIEALQSVQELGKGIFDEHGQITDSGMRKMVNATNVTNPQMLARLEKIKPGITEAIKDYKALADVEAAANKFKVGTYEKAMGTGFAFHLIGGGGLMSVVAGVTEMILTKPENAVKIIQTYAKSKPVIEGVITKLKQNAKNTLQTLNQLPDKQPAMVGSVFGRSRQ